MDNRDELSFKYRSFHRDNALYWNNHANQRQFELAKQLITLGSIVLTVSAVFIASSEKGIGFQSQSLASLSLLLSWIFILISIGSGLKQLEVDTEYFNYLSNDETIRETKFVFFTFEIAMAEVNRMHPTSPRGNEKWLFIQQIFFILGVVFITLSAFFILLFSAS